MLHGRRDAIQRGGDAFLVVAAGALEVDRLRDGEVAHHIAGGEDQRGNFAQVCRPAIDAEMQEGVAEVDEGVERVVDLAVER